VKGERQERNITPAPVKKKGTIGQRMVGREGDNRFLGVQKELQYKSAEKKGA